MAFGGCGWIVLATLALAAPEVPDSVGRDKQALVPVQAYVGAWRGVGQPRRGSNVGAWTEQMQWAWRFHDGRAELVATLDGDKYFRSLRLQPTDKPGRFRLLALPQGASGDDAAAERAFRAELKGGALVATADEPVADAPARISIRLVAGGDRMVVLIEKQLGAEAYGRLAEIGSTRQGSDFARSAASGPECIVTGGLGTIAVEHKGKKYFVCCTGCREYFDEDPERAIAEYRERKAAEKAGK